MLEKIDEFILHHIQEAYLKLYDWTGVYVGTVMAICSMALIAIALTRGFSPIVYVLVGLNVLILMFAQMWWSRQRSLSVGAYNTLILAIREVPGRRFFTLFQVFMLSQDLIALIILRGSENVRSTIMSGMLLVSVYVQYILIRERKPPEFLQPAPQSTT